MNLPLFLSRRIYGNDGTEQLNAADNIRQKKSVSRPAIMIATIGVAIGLAVMIIAVSVVVGFKHTVRDKVTGFGSHMLIENVLSYNSMSNTYPVCIDDSTRKAWEDIEGVQHAERFSIASGILKTEEDFLGVALKGIAQEYDQTFLAENLVEGELPVFSDSATSYPLAISQTIAQKLQLKLNDRVFAYFVDEEGVRVRRFNICAMYQTNMKRFDDSYCFTDLYAINKINGWLPSQCSGAELLVDDFDKLDETSKNVIKHINRSVDRQGNVFSSRTIYDVYPQIFSWLDLLDLNVWIILGLMIILAGFTMASGLLIIILERTQMIGILKSFGARNIVIRKTFLWFAAFIIGKGLLWGNIIGIGIIVVQRTTGILKVDPQNYYVTEVPMDLNLVVILLLNIATLLLCLLALIAPSYLVSTIMPARSMRYE